ncbi:Phage tail assembly protein [plant metagenome]|uniref:Phage tail assembly protein n=1 Tax=plant metagenome TaxID=1297885 RepID=A0A484TX51_9ZZZZ
MRKATLAAMRMHAERDYPRECCGLVVSTVGGGEAYVPCRNTAADGDQFVLPAQDYAAAEDLGRVVAVVHSHPDAAATPSEADRVACELSGLRWLIVSVRPDSQGRPKAQDIHAFAPEGYQAPLLGRAFHHGVLDCYTLLRDWYARERGIDLPDFVREDRWWEGERELYLDNFAQAGFRPLSDDEVLRPGDVVLMQVHSRRTNHAGIYLGNEPLRERPDLHPLADAMLHHLYGRLAERVVYGGYWRDATRRVLRHRDCESSI